MSRRLGLLTPLYVLTLALAGCSGSDGTTATDTDATGTDATIAGGSTTEPAGTTSGVMPTTGEGTSSGEPDTSTGELKLGDIIVEVTYTGAQVGTLSLAAVTSFPPEGPPQASLTEKMPVFPFTGTLKGLEPKDYFIAAVLDIGDNNPQMPGPEDLVAFTAMPITIVGDDMPMISLVLMDKK